MTNDRGTSWRALAEEKQEKRRKLIPQAWQLNEITSEGDAVDLVAKLKSGAYTAEEVTSAFCKRAAVAHQLTNCLTEIFFDDALARARELDKERSTKGADGLRPLHGLPISLKDSFRVPKVDSTIGLACFAGQPDDHYSALPQLLVDLGAVLYCKTNVPQTMMTGDSDNNVFGRTLNPNNRNLTAGGSTGGEGALIALRGSIAGMGTDVAGSIRIPSACNGIYGFKPSAWVVPFGGQRSPVTPGAGGIEPVAGPITTSIRACGFLLETIVKAKPWLWDESCNHTRWLDVKVDSKPRIGVVYDDGLYTPHPPVRRTIKESVAKLEEAGLEVVPIRLPNTLEAFLTTINTFYVDENKCIKDLIASTGEPHVPSVVKKDLPNTPRMDMTTLFALTATRQRVQAEYHRLWTTHQIDAILAPAAPHTAVPLDEWVAISYTCLWNLLDYPACIIPTGRVRADDVKDSVSEAKYGNMDKEVYDLYTGPEGFVDAPTCVQLVGQRQEDEAFLQIARLVDEIVNNKSHSNGT